MSEKTRFHVVEIYEYDIEVVFTTSAIASQKNKKRIKRLGEEPQSNFVGMVWYSEKGSKMAILFTKEGLTHNTIAHEAFHAAHRILEYVGHDFHVNGHEPFAYLCGYITELIYKDLKKWKLRVK